MSKQDRQGVRTFDQLMRRFNLDGIDADVVTEMFKQISQVNEHLTSLNTTVTQKLNLLLSSNQTWFYSGVPTLETYPSDDWTTEELKSSHIGDMYYDTNDGKIYIFIVTQGVYAWKICFVDYETAYNNGYAQGYTDGYTDAQEGGESNADI